MRNSIVGVTALAVILLMSVVVLALPQNQDADARCGKKCHQQYREARNRINQNNEAIANQNGGDVAQSQLNAAALETDNTDLNQKNKATSKGADSSFQNQHNAADIDGDNNNVRQSNDAKSDADNSVIIQGNNAETEGDNNNVHQSNRAEQTGSGGSQSVSQSNTANSNNED
jgi:hypothetical protein